MKKLESNSEKNIGATSKTTATAASNGVSICYNTIAALVMKHHHSRYSTSTSSSRRSLAEYE